VSYEPYGGAVAGTPIPKVMGFTGHVNDGNTGLVYMQQRYYDPIVGRFLSVDPVTTDASTGDSFSRYAYAYNNPLKFVDPDGRYSTDACVNNPGATCESYTAPPTPKTPDTSTPSATGTGSVATASGSQRGRLRWVFAVVGGVVERVGWQDPKHQTGPNSGFGFRVYISIGDGVSDIYAHMDPSTVSVGVGERVAQGQYIGMYADPSNGMATGPHLHFERRDRSGSSIEIDWSNILQLTPISGAHLTSGFGIRVHPVLGTKKLHGGYDFVGPGIE
jgi:RHS repeat-associated protein